MSTLISTIHEHLPNNAFLEGVCWAVIAFTSIVLLNVASQLLQPVDRNLPPAVFYYVPWVGSSVSYGMDPYGFMDKCRKKYGDVFTFILAGRPVTVALGPSGSNLILNGKLANVSAEDAYTNFTTPVFGTEVVYDCPNELLVQQKKFMKFGLSTEHFRRYVGIIAKEVQQHISNDLFHKSNKRFNGSNVAVADSVDVSGGITICTAAATLQGREVRAGLDKSFADLYHDLDGGFTPLNWIFPNLPLPSYWKRDAAHIKMRHFYFDIMNKRREEGNTSEQDMIQALQGQTYKDGTPVSDKQIAHMMIALLMAGQHTSAATGGWLLLHIGHDQQLQEALYQEQVKYWGNPDGSFKPLDYDTLQTPLLHACIKEVLRLHPPIHSIMRVVREPLVVPPTLAGNAQNKDHTFVIPKGYTVLACPGYSQIDPAFWEQPEKFDAQRWFTASGEAKADEEGEKEDFGYGAVSTGANSPYLPFGAGRHRCIGEQFANVQMATIFATLIQNTQWKLNAPFPTNDYTTMIVMPTKPRDLTFTRR